MLNVLPYTDRRWGAYLSSTVCSTKNSPILFFFLISSHFIVEISSMSWSMGLSPTFSRHLNFDRMVLWLCSWFFFFFFLISTVCWSKKKKKNQEHREQDNDLNVWRQGNERTKGQTGREKNWNFQLTFLLLAFEPWCLESWRSVRDTTMLPELSTIRQESPAAWEA